MLAIKRYDYLKINSFRNFTPVYVKLTATYIVEFYVERFRHSKQKNTARSMLLLITSFIEKSIARELQAKIVGGTPVDSNVV